MVGFPGPRNTLYCIGLNGKAEKLLDSSMDSEISIRQDGTPAGRMLGPW